MSFVFYGGDGGDRTLDLTDANRTLSQLSYAPILSGQATHLYYKYYHFSLVFSTDFFRDFNFLALGILIPDHIPIMICAGTPMTNIK